MTDGGKGSKPRPFSVSLDLYDANYETIFGKQKNKLAYKQENSLKETEQNERTTEDNFQEKT